MWSISTGLPRPLEATVSIVFVWRPSIVRVAPSSTTVDKYTMDTICHRRLQLDQLTNDLFLK